jgi:hypothetical protein
VVVLEELRTGTQMTGMGLLGSSTLSGMTTFHNMEMQVLISWQ